MQLLQSNTTVVGRVRVRSNSSDPQLRQRIQQILHGATLAPAGLPPAATLVIRHLDDPLPNRFRTGVFSAEPDHDWQRAANHKLHALFSKAARPMASALPAAANAILFLNHSEILASLAADWLRGSLSTNWWWQCIFPSFGMQQANLLAEWMRASEHVPAAMQLLAGINLAQNFAKTLTDDSAKQLRERVCYVHGIREIKPEELSGGRSTSRERAPSSDSPFALGLADSASKTQPTMESENLSGEADKSQLIAPWAAWVSEAGAPGLSLEAQLLLAQSLMLARRPFEVRSANYQHRAAIWLDETQKRNAREMPVMASRNSVASSPHRESADPEAAAHTETTSTGELLTSTDANALDTELAHHIDPLAASRAPSFANAAETRGELSTQLSRNLSSTAHAGPNCLAASASALAAAEIQTEFGGVFFLLNVALALGLYSDFTAPLGPNLELPIWDFLALVGAKFSNDALKRDELWNLLAVLAGRDCNREPGFEFAPPKDWRIPDDWLIPSASSSLGPAILRNDRSQVEHPLEFLGEELQDGENSQLDHAARMDRWLEWLGAYFRARLVLALGRPDAVELLCHCPAHVAHTVTHLDVTYDLQRHPVEIRIAGLDRNPGWIPASGRYITFHFE